VDPLESLQAEARAKCARVYHQVQEDGDHVGFSPKTLDVLLKYSGGLHSDLRKQVMLFKPRTIDEAYVKAQYPENICHKKGQPNGSK
jgi:hypothetical protein